MSTINDFKGRACEEAEVLVHKVFPKKVVDLNKMLNSKKFADERVHEVSSVDPNIPVPKKNSTDGLAKKRRVEDGDPVYTLPTGDAPANKPILELVDMVKPELHQLIDHANKVKMWIAYMIPKIEDGNNFGVSIQEETIAEAAQVEVYAEVYLDEIAKYFLARAKLVCKLAKYPFVEDFRRAIREVDEKEFVTLLNRVREIRNKYSTLHDLILKNLDKIKRPRAYNGASMY